MPRKQHKPKREQCTYCLGPISGSDITEDHIISRRWYPPSTPSTVKRWRAYACRKCNNEKSHLEQCMLLRLATCVDPKNPASAGIWERAKRAMDVEIVSDPNERARRLAARQGFLRDVAEVNTLPTEGLLPSFSSNFDQGSRMVVRLAANHLDPLVEFWARGIYRHIWGMPPEETTEMTVVHLTDEHAAEAFKGLEAAWRRLDGGPGVQVAFIAATAEEQRTTWFDFLIWKQFRAYVIAEDRVVNLASSASGRR